MGERRRHGRPKALSEPPSVLASLRATAPTPRPRPRATSAEAPAPPRRSAPVVEPPREVLTWDGPAPPLRDAAPPPAAAPPAPAPPPVELPLPPLPSAASLRPRDVDGGVHRVRSLGAMLSDEEVARALDDIRNPRRRTAQASSEGAVLDGFIDHLRRAPATPTPAPAPVVEPPRSPAPPPPAAPPPPRPRALDLELAALAGVSALSGGPAAPAPPPPPPPATAPAPTAPAGPATAPASGPAPLVLTGTVGDGGHNAAGDVRAVKRRLIALGFNWITADETCDADTIATIRLFQAIVAGHAKVTGVDGLIEPGKTTNGWLDAANAPRWGLLPAGADADGYINAERADAKDVFDYGTDWLSDTLVAAGATYQAGHRAANPTAVAITANDASLPRGVPHGTETPDHSGHKTGLEVDLLLPRTDGRAGGILVSDALYDRAAMRAQLLALRAQPLFHSALLNDDDLIKEGLCVREDGHANHAHVRIRPPERRAP